MLSDRGSVGEPFHMVCGGIARPEDPRFVDELDYGTVIFWRCEAQASLEARSRFVKSKLADIDRQFKDAPLGIVHIGMDAERDNAASDLRRQKNREAVSAFRAASNLIEVDLHYFLPRVT